MPDSFATGLSSLKDYGKGPDLSTLQDDYGVDSDAMTKQMETFQKYLKSKSQPNDWGGFLTSFFNFKRPNFILYIILLIVINSNVLFMFTCNNQKDYSLAGGTRAKRSGARFEKTRESFSNVFGIITDAFSKAKLKNHNSIQKVTTEICINDGHTPINSIMFILAPIILLLTGLYSFITFIVDMTGGLVTGINAAWEKDSLIQIAVFLLIWIFTFFFIWPLLLCGLFMMILTIGKIGIMPGFKSSHIPKIIKQNSISVQAIIGAAIVIAGLMNLNNTISTPMSYVYIFIMACLVLYPIIINNFNI